jgi:hypothetical protein
MPNWKKVIVSGSDASLNSLNVATNVVAQSFTGSLFGTASFAVTSSYALSASQAISSSYAISASYSTSASQALTSSFVTSSNVFGPYGSNSILSSSYGTTSSYATTFNVENSFTASGLNYPSADNGVKSFIQSDGLGNLSLQYVNTMYEQVKNGEIDTILTGTPLYVSGAIGANQIVYRADAGDPTKMPVTYIAGGDIPAGEAGLGIILGLIEGVNTTGYPAGTEVFVAVGGGWTSTRPTGSAIVQSLGIVSREGTGTSGKGIVLNPGPNNLPNIQPNYLWIGDSNNYPIQVSTSSLIVDQANNADLLDNRDSTTFANTGSNDFTGTQYISNDTNATSFTSTASLYTDGGLRVTKDAYVSGTLYTNNLTVYGTASVQYVTESIFIGGAFINLNTFVPAERYAGINVYDSGSVGVSASIWYDSEKNDWIFVHQDSGSTDVETSIFLYGPLTTNDLGNETTMSANYIVKVDSEGHGHHLTTSSIFDNGINVSVLSNLIVSGSTTITGSLGVGTTGSAVVGRIDASNDVVAFSTSDRDLKKNIKPIKNAIEKVEQIGGYTFDWKKDKKNIHGFSGHDVGVIAQEIEAVLPEVVTTRENGYKAVRYEKIIPLLIEAIKEQQNKINELENLLKQNK